MTHKKKFLSGFFLIALCCLIFAGIGANTSVCAAEATTIAPAAQLFELSDNNDYNIEWQQEVTSFAYGKSSLGSFSINGDIDDVATYRGKTAYGVSGNLSFSYTYNGYLQGNSAESWNISSDTATSVAGYSLTGSVGQGVVLIQTSTNGSVYENVVNPVTDFFSGKNGRENFYTTDGNTVAQGSFYRIIIAYETRRKTGTTGIWPFKKDVFEYKNNVEIYEFYVCRNDAVISIHNLAVDESSLPEIEGYTQETIKRGETLLDGSTTTKGFSIDKLGSSYLVSVAKDGGTASYVDDGATFTENGKYVITTITKLGKQITRTVYIFNGGEDKGFSTYFGDSIVDGKRVFRYGDYPTYAKGSSVRINAIADNVPILTGKITNMTSGEEFVLASDRNGQIFDLVAGSYCLDCYSGETASGTVYHYKAYFNIIDELSAPYVNYDNLMKTQRLSDLTSKHYEVAYQTTAGGYIFVCFDLDSYDEAFNYAYEIEKRFIEKTDDGLYYKSKDNPNVKVKYYDYVAMTSVLNYYARQNVEYNYFNPIDAFTYQTYADNLLEQLESLSIRESIKVFPSQAEKDKLINRQPFINDFTFIKAADYDVVSVNAYCHKNGKTYTIEFGKDVSQQLTVSSKYTITETNAYGDTKVYDVYYANENQTTSTWDVSYNGVKSTLSVSSSTLVNNKIEITADTISISSIENNFDINSIVTVKAPEVYSFEIKCLISEFKNIGLYKKGKYELTFVDRVGNSYQLIINITGKSRYSDVVTSSIRSYTNFYNAVYMNDRTEREEIIYDITALKTAIDRVVDKNLYTPSSYANYVRYLQEARDVYENQNANQEEINAAALNLDDAYAALVRTVDKTALSNELNKFETINKGAYTTASYNAYKEAYDSGCVIFEKDEPTSEEIAFAVQSLKNAYESLVLRGDKTELYAKMQDVKGVDCSLYTPDSIESLNEAYEQAATVFADIDATQTEIDAMLNLLASRKSALVFVADFSSLLTAIEQVQTIDETLYTTATIEKLKTKYNEAVAIYKDRNNTQSVVTAAKNALVQAKNALVLCGNSTELKTLVDEIAKIPYMIYSKETIQPLLTKYNESLLMLDARYTQSEINTIKDELLLLKSSLDIREDKQELYNILTEMAQIDISGYSKKKQEAFVSIYNSAMETLNSLDSTEEQVSSAKQSIETAKNNLETKNVGLKWWVIVLICIGALILMGIAQAILSEVIMTDYWPWMWIVSIAALVVLLIFVPLPWWAISLIEFGVIAIMTIILDIVEEV